MGLGDDENEKFQSGVFVFKMEGRYFDMKSAEEDRLGERVCLKIHETKWLVDEDLGNQEIPI